MKAKTFISWSINILLINVATVAFMLIVSRKTFLKHNLFIFWILSGICRNQFFFFLFYITHRDLLLIFNWLPWQVLPASTAWLGTASTASEDPREPPERPVTPERRDHRVSQATARRPCAWPPRRTPHPDYRRREQSKDRVSRRPSPQQGRDGMERPVFLIGDNDQGVGGDRQRWL